MDIDKALSFMATHARVLDRRRMELLLGGTDITGVLAAVDAYRNPDGGYGWGLEPDLRAGESQPGGALHALEVFAEIGPATTPRALELCDWLDSVTLPDGGLPFALPVADQAGVAPFWANADPKAASLQSTAFVAGVALRVAAFDPAVAAHPWLAKAVRYCSTAIESLTEAPHAIAVSFAVQFADFAPDSVALLAKLRQFIPADGVLSVEGGSEGEAIRPLHMSPLPGRTSRGMFSQESIDADLRRLAAGQQDDGGWKVDFASFSPTAALEWRGYETVRALSILNGQS
jgi:hypothetical protein